jgi:hypothetical protein
MKTYYHDDHTQTIFEARAKPDSNIAASSIYYLAYRVAIGNAIWYHHTLLLADNIEDLLKGTSAIQGIIRNSIHPSAAVSLQFIRSQFSEDERIIESSFGQNIYKEINEQISSGQEKNDSYKVFGVIGEDREEYRMTLMNVKQKDANGAIVFAYAHILNKMHEPFSPLDVFPTHPVTQDLVAHYQAASSKLQALIGRPSAPAMTLH